MPHAHSKSVVLIVAHPDDETLWAGGTLLANPAWECFVLCLCRGSDLDRAPKFHAALSELGATGVIGDLDDGLDQDPLDSAVLARYILELLPPKHYDLAITHSPVGEYTRHRRHEEVSQAAIKLWSEDLLSTKSLWCFAYEDGNRAYLPTPIETATSHQELPTTIWKKKYEIMTRTYGFGEDSWEARATPKAEAFWQFDHAEDATTWASKETLAKR